MFKKFLVGIVAIASFLIANGCTTGCIEWFFDEPEMPKSLIK